MWRDVGIDWNGLFYAETAEWRAWLLENPQDDVGESVDESGTPSADDRATNVPRASQNDDLKPLQWARFSYQRSSKTSKVLSLVPDIFVNISIPSGHTHREVIVKIAKESQIPIDSLADDLSQPVFTRGQAIFGYLGDEIDKIARNYTNMRWWVSDRGLNMAVVDPAEMLVEPQSAPQLSKEDGKATATADQVPARDSKLISKTGKGRGRLPNKERRAAIRKAIQQQGERWRDHLPEVFTELDNQEVSLGDFSGFRIDLGDGESTQASNWADLDLAQGEQRKRVVDALRKYAD